MIRERTRVMKREEYLERKARAQRLMAADYEWLLSQPKGKYEWKESKRWLIEWVNDVGNYEVRLDERLRPVPIRRLYERCFEALCLPLPLHPTAILSKLRAQEQRHDIMPDYVTLFYMNHLEEMEETPNVRILHRLVSERRPL